MVRQLLSERGHLRLWYETDLSRRPNDVSSRGDSVAKVALPKVSKFLRAAGAFFV